MNAELTVMFSRRERTFFERGAALLLLQVFLLPVLALLFFLGRNYSERRATGIDLQLELDTAVTTALDAGGDAKQTAELLERSCANLRNRYADSGAHDVFCRSSLSGRRATIEMSQSSDGVTVSRHSVAIRPKLRTVVVMSNSRSMAPDLTPVIGDIEAEEVSPTSEATAGIRDFGWGNSAYWPSSSAWAGLNLNERQRRFRRLITQSCFNPVYSLVKSGAQALQYLVQRDSYPLTVYLTPGNIGSAARGFEILSDGVGVADDFRAAEPSVHFPQYRSGEVSARVCAALSLRDYSGRYANHYSAAERKYAGDRSDELSSSVWRQNSVNNSSDYLKQHLLLSEAIYWAPIAADVPDVVELEGASNRRQSSSAAARALMAAMSHVLGSLAENNAENKAESNVGGRRNLQAGWVVLFADRVPSLGEVLKIGESLVIYAGNGLPVSVELFVVENPYQRRAQALRSRMPFEEVKQVEKAISGFNLRLSSLSHNAANFRLLNVASQEELASEIEHSWRARRRASIVE